MRNLLVVAQQLGKIDPDQLERTFGAINAGMNEAAKPASDDTPYNPPGVTGVFKLLHDKELWATLSPLIAGARAYSQARRGQQSDGENAGENKGAE